MTFGPEVAMPIRTAGGTIEPRIAMEGVWDFVGTQRLSARVNGGVQFQRRRRRIALLAGGYRGLFAPAFSNWNAQSGHSGNWAQRYPA